MNTKLIELTKQISELIDTFDLEEKVDALNYSRSALHKVSPFIKEPTDLIQWVKNDTVVANSYNPNNVQKTEFELLKLSIEMDGITQPIVTMPSNGNREVIDGYHRHLVGKNYEPIQQRIHGYLPVVTINSDREDITDRMSSTVRHNRARGKHKVESMSDIVIELKKRNWNDAKIAKHLGMDADEVLRLTQITGLAEMFKDREFSKSWEIVPEEAEITEIVDEVQ